MFLRNVSRSFGSSSRSISTLVVAEQNGGKLNPSTLNAVGAASRLGGEVTILLAGEGAKSASSQAASISGVSKVLTAENGAYNKMIAENVTNLVVSVQEANKFTHIVAPSSNVSKNFIPRVGAKLDAAPLTDVLEVVDAETFKRPTYAGNAIATVKSSDDVKIMTVRTTAFDKAAEEGGSASVEDAAECPAADAGLSSFVSEEVSSSERPDLSSARVVIAGGRGMKNGENFAMLETLADKLGGAVGASRAAVDAGFVPNEYQVGQTGKVVAPDLYVAVGISGAIQHLAGMKDSKTIVCVNKDEEAPIFQVSDYGLVDDLFKVVPELTEKV